MTVGGIRAGFGTVTALRIRSQTVEDVDSTSPDQHNEYIGYYII